jgi:hypothetical protein
VRDETSSKLSVDCAASMGCVKLCNPKHHYRVVSAIPSPFKTNISLSFERATRSRRPFDHITRKSLNKSKSVLNVVFNSIIYICSARMVGFEGEILSFEISVLKKKSEKKSYFYAPAIVSSEMIFLLRRKISTNTNTKEKKNENEILKIEILQKQTLAQRDGGEMAINFSLADSGAKFVEHKFCSGRQLI